MVVMAASFHQIVDDADGSLMPLGGEMEVDHGGIQTAMAEILLNAPDVDPGLQQMGGIRVPEGVDGNALFDVELFEHPSQGALDR